jgi:hypothetical protein
MFVGIKEENTFEECSSHVDTSDRLDVILNKLNVMTSMALS